MRLNSLFTIICYNTTIRKIYGAPQVLQTDFERSTIVDLDNGVVLKTKQISRILQIKQTYSTLINQLIPGPSTFEGLARWLGIQQTPQTAPSHKDERLSSHLVQVAPLVLAWVTSQIFPNEAVVFATFCVDLYTKGRKNQ